VTADCAHAPFNELKYATQDIKVQTLQIPTKMIASRTRLFVVDKASRVRVLTRAVASDTYNALSPKQVVATAPLRTTASYAAIDTTIVAVISNSLMYRYEFTGGTWVLNQTFTATGGAYFMNVALNEQWFVVARIQPFPYISLQFYQVNGTSAVSLRQQLSTNAIIDPGTQYDLFLAITPSYCDRQHVFMMQNQNNVGPGFYIYGYDNGTSQWNLRSSTPFDYSSGFYTGSSIAAGCNVAAFSVPTYDPENSIFAFTTRDAVSGNWSGLVTSYSHFIGKCGIGQVAVVRDTTIALSCTQVAYQAGADTGFVYLFELGTNNTIVSTRVLTDYCATTFSARLAFFATLASYGQQIVAHVSGKNNVGEALLQYGWPCETSNCMADTQCVVDPENYNHQACVADNDCPSPPCANDGACIDLVGGYVCNCTSAWSGSYCQTPSSCAANPCANGSTCADGSGSFTCACPPNRTGQLCDLTVSSSALPSSSGLVSSSLAQSSTGAAASSSSASQSSTGAAFSSSNAQSSSGGVFSSSSSSAAVFSSSAIQSSSSSGSSSSSALASSTAYDNASETAISSTALELSSSGISETFNATEPLDTAGVAISYFAAATSVFSIASAVQFLV
jgi:hypothetical protein